MDVSGLDLLYALCVATVGRLYIVLGSRRQASGAKTSVCCMRACERNIAVCVCDVRAMQISVIQLYQQYYGFYSSPSFMLFRRKKDKKKQDFFYAYFLQKVKKVKKTNLAY